MNKNKQINIIKKWMVNKAYPEYSFDNNLDLIVVGAFVTIAASAEIALKRKSSAICKYEQLKSITNSIACRYNLKNFLEIFQFFLIYI